MIIRENYITDTFETDFKDMDGEILSMLSYVDKEQCGDVLCYGDIGVMEIWNEENEESCFIQEDNQYELISCSCI